MFPAFLELAADELHLEMASRELAEIELIEEIAAGKDVGVGVIDVKSYYVETPEDVEERIRACLRYVAGRAAVSVARLRPLADGALGGARESWHMVEGARRVRESHRNVCRTLLTRLEREGARRVRDEDLLRELVAELALQPRLEAREEVVEARPAAVGAQHRRAAGVAARADAPAWPRSARSAISARIVESGQYFVRPGPSSWSHAPAAAVSACSPASGLRSRCARTTERGRDAEPREPLDELEAHRAVLRVDADRRARRARAPARRPRTPVASNGVSRW